MGPGDAGGLAEDRRGRTRLGKVKRAERGPSDTGGLAEDWRLEGRRNRRWYWS